ncbi:asparaginase [Rhodobaculum claviforme]|uniref:L-asparaginase n=1 Tax=Rhodobaculum claviforme TaxID=1549854 RepID=A0A934TIR2_9RHOB|nr:asparaginase [Rhodobaculum claviforme]MBK5925947.1 L-asparaginase [Rhodobaculum claviforme]
MAIPMVEVWRGDRVESRHAGDAVVCDASGAVVAAWGAAEAVIFPRSSCKMVQALPLVESGAADGLGPEQLALACASHQGAAIHTDRVAAWLAALGLDATALRCGAHVPHDAAAAAGLIRGDTAPCQIHNNCSGKHAGFLTLARHLGAGPEYIDLDHPVQRAVRQTFEEVTGEDSPGWAIDGCSAPNFATSLTGLARAMAAFAGADDGSVRGRAMVRLREAMTAHPDLVAGEGRACTGLMRAMGGHVAVKTGAEGVFVAILPEQRLGVALKIADGAGRAAETAIAALLVRLGVLDAAAPGAARWLAPPLTNWRGVQTGHIAPAPGFP